MILNNSKKDTVQADCIKAWEENNYKGTIVVGTGVGKTKIGLMAIKKLYDDWGFPGHFSALIVVPTTNLRDNEWVNEIDRWYPELAEYITIECIKTAYKVTYETDIIVVDEIHTTLSPEYRNFHVNNTKDCPTIGLTATEPHVEEYGELLKEICPIIYKLTMKESADMGLISKFKVENVYVSFTKKELAKYKIYDKMFHNALILLSNRGNAFEMARQYKDDKTSILHKTAKSFWNGMSMRRWTCYKAERKLQACIDIIENVKRDKWIIFSQHIEFVEKLSDMLRERGIMAVYYHSKLKPKDKALALEAAKSPMCKVICSAQALVTGYNLPEIDSAICVASTGSELTFTQSLGRSSRLNESGKYKKALYINVYVRNTQEDRWVKNRLDEEDLKPFSVEELIAKYAKT